MATLWALFLAAATTFMGRIAAGISGYLMIHGWQIATRFLPLATVTLSGLILYIVGSHLTLSGPARIVLGGSVVALALASFAFGFQVRDECPTWMLPRPDGPAK